MREQADEQLDTEARLRGADAADRALHELYDGFVLTARGKVYSKEKIASEHIPGLVQKLVDDSTPEREVATSAMALLGFATAPRRRGGPKAAHAMFAAGVVPAAARWVARLAPSRTRSNEDAGGLGGWVPVAACALALVPEIPEAAAEARPFPPRSQALLPLPTTLQHANDAAHRPPRNKQVASAFSALGLGPDGPLRAVAVGDSAEEPAALAHAIVCMAGAALAAGPRARLLADGRFIVRLATLVADALDSLPRAASRRGSKHLGSRSPQGSLSSAEASARDVAPQQSSDDQEGSGGPGSSAAAEGSGEGSAPASAAAGEPLGANLGQASMGSDFSQLRDAQSEASLLSSPSVAALQALALLLRACTPGEALALRRAADAMINARGSAAGEPPSSRGLAGVLLDSVAYAGWPTSRQALALAALSGLVHVQVSGLWDGESSVPESRTRVHITSLCPSVLSQLPSLAQDWGAPSAEALECSLPLQALVGGRDQPASGALRALLSVAATGHPSATRSLPPVLAAVLAQSDPQRQVELAVSFAKMLSVPALYDDAAVSAGAAIAAAAPQLVLRARRQAILNLMLVMNEGAASASDLGPLGLDTPSSADAAATLPSSSGHLLPSRSLLRVPEGGPINWDAGRLACAPLAEMARYDAVGMNLLCGLLKNLIGSVRRCATFSLLFLRIPALHVFSYAMADITRL